MAITASTKLIDLALLQAYDVEIKKIINASIDTTSLHTVALDSSVRKIYFYTQKAADVTVGTTTAAFTVDLSDIDTKLGDLTALKTTAKGSLVAAINEIYDAIGTETLTTTATTVKGAINELDAAIDLLNDADTVTGSVAKSIKDAVEALDTTADVVIASKDASTHKVTLKAGVKEEDGIIAQGTGADIVLGTAANEDIKAGAIADADGETATLDETLVNAAQVVKYVKDKTADISGALHFRGIKTATSDITDPAQGDVVIVGTTEYIYDGANWQELGDEGNYVPKARTVAGVDLVDDITKAEMLTALNVEDDADVNIIEGVQVNGTDLTPDTDKKVNVTVATGATNGTIAVNGVDVAVNLVLADATDITAMFPTT